MISLMSMLAMGTSTIFGFKVLSVEELPDISAKIWRMEYEKNGAELVWVECPDENRTFVITFRTLPEDDTGVAHILEHAVLCGSEKFPSREPFVELLKSSPHTYLNAYTAKDSTGYPCASRNEKDFLNLTEVYLDAVFHPETVKSDWSMRQEGWHYEYDGTNITRNGIVYSEMKGALSSPMTRMYHDVTRLLFPDTVYGKLSGGDPKHIPELSFDKYREFHRRFYHPSNARIFLYGNIDLKKTLPLISSALEPFDRRDEKIEISVQAPVLAEETHAYASSEEKDKTLYGKAWVVGEYDDVEKLMGLQVLSDLLTGSNFSPLKAPFLKSGICEDVGMGLINDRQMTLMVNLHNVKDGEVENAEKLLTETLEKLVREGLDHTRIAQILDKHEFAWRERDTSDRGMNIYHSVMDSWLYGGDPAQNLRATPLFKSLRDRIDTGWYEEILKSAVIGNPHSCKLTMIPSSTLAAEEAARDAKALAALRDSLSAEELSAIAESAADLKRRHEAPEAPEILAKLPRLTLADMSEDCEILGREIVAVDGVTVIRPDLKLSGFFYLDLSFSLKNLTRNELLDATLLTDMFGELGSAKRSAEELSGVMDGTFGSFVADVASYEKGPELVVRIAALDSHRAAALDLAQEILLSTDFSDREAIETQRQQNRVWMQESTRGRNALDYLSRRTVSTLSRAEALQDMLKGIGQIRHLQNDQVGDLKALAEKIFTRENLTIAAAGDVSDEFIADVISRFPSVPSESAAPFDIPLAPLSEGLVIDGNVGFAGLAAKLPDGFPYTGAQLVGGKIISLAHLWPELRVKGGAYGAFFSIGANRTFSFRSYRDPNPAHAYEEYAKAGERLAEFVASGESYEKFQVSSLSYTDPNFSPREKMAYVRSQYFNGRDPELPRKLRHEIIHTSKEDLLAFAEMLTKTVPSASRCTIGAEKLLEPCEFEKIEKIVRK